MGTAIKRMKDSLYNFINYNVEEKIRYFKEKEETLKKMEQICNYNSVGEKIEQAIKSGVSDTFYISPLNVDFVYDDSEYTYIGYMKNESFVSELYSDGELVDLLVLEDIIKDLITKMEIYLLEQIILC